jgi:hypothetical protein
LEYERVRTALRGASSFSHILVIAISGEFSGTAPEALIADHFFRKGSYRPEELFERIADLISRAPLRPQMIKPDRAPVWIPRNAEGYMVTRTPGIALEANRSAPIRLGQVRVQAVPEKGRPALLKLIS